MKDGDSVKNTPQIKPRKAEKQDGVVLLMVLLLVVLFSGLGLLAMRHTQGDLRSSGAYLNSTQAAAAAESAIMMVATDMRRNWQYPNESSCLNYYNRFQQAMYNSENEKIKIGFSDVFNTSDAACEHRGRVPLNALRGAAPLALTGGPLSHGYADVQLYQTAPEIAPPPPGFSSDDEASTYDWYYFTVTAEAAYGYGPSLGENDALTVKGSAVVRSHMKIGPVDSIGSN